MEYLEKFEWNISLVDGMLIETGGKFAESKLYDYINYCLEIAKKYYQDKKEKTELLKIVDFYIILYKNETSWKYYHYEMTFLNTLKTKIEQL